MTEKQKTKTVEFKTRNSKVKFKVRKGIARMGAGLKYPNAKEVVPKEEHDKLEYDRDYWERQYNNAIDSSIKIQKEHDKLKEDLDDKIMQIDSLEMQIDRIPKEKVRELITETEKETGSSGHTALRLLKQKIKLLGDKK